MRYPPPVNKANAIKTAAAFVRGDRLGKLYLAIEGKKSISTRKIERLLDEILDDMKIDGLFIKALSQRIEGDV